MTYLFNNQLKLEMMTNCLEVYCCQGNRGSKFCTKQTCDKPSTMCTNDNCDCYHPDCLFFSNIQPNFQKLFDRSSEWKNSYFSLIQRFNLLIKTIETWKQDAEKIIQSAERYESEDVRDFYTLIKERDYNGISPIMVKKFIDQTAKNISKSEEKFECLKILKIFDEMKTTLNESNKRLMIVLEEEINSQNKKADKTVEKNQKEKVNIFIKDEVKNVEIESEVFEMIDYDGKTKVFTEALELICQNLTGEVEIEDIPDKGEIVQKIDTLNNNIEAFEKEGNQNSEDDDIGQTLMFIPRTTVIHKDEQRQNEDRQQNRENNIVDIFHIEKSSVLLSQIEESCIYKTCQSSIVQASLYKFDSSSTAITQAATPTQTQTEPQSQQRQPTLLPDSLVNQSQKIPSFRKLSLDEQHKSISLQNSRTRINTSHQSEKIVAPETELKQVEENIKSESSCCEKSSEAAKKKKKQKQKGNNEEKLTKEEKKQLRAFDEAVREDKE